MTRQIPFEGDDAAYICFLEARVLQLQDYHRRSSQELTNVEMPFRNPADMDKDRDKSESFTTSHRNTWQIQNPSEKQIYDIGTQPAQKALIEQRQLRKDDGDFEFIEYDPEADPNDKKKSTPVQSEELQLKDLTKFTTFLNKLPKSKDWKNWISAIDKDKRRELLRGWVHSCSSDASSFPSLKASDEFGVASSNPADISILSKYANFVNSSEELNKQITYFQKILFVSLCAVALEQGWDKDGVYEVMRTVIKTDASKKHLDKLVRGVKWANNLMSILSKTKWASRSWDILCVAKRPVSFYARLNDCAQDSIAKLNGMKTDYTGKGTSAPFVIPLIINEIFRNTVPLERICQTLGYELSSLEPYWEIFKNALSEGHAEKRPASPIHEPSKRHCRDNYSSPRSEASSTSRDSQNLARSDVSDPPGSASQGVVLFRGVTPTVDPLVDRDSADEVLPELPECLSVSVTDGTPHTERLRAQSTFTVVEEGIVSAGSVARAILPTRTGFTQWTDELVESIAIYPVVDSCSSSLGGFDTILSSESQDDSITRNKRRRTQTTQNSSAIQFSSNSFAYDTFNARQCGQSTMSLDDSAAEGALAMQFGSNSLAPHSTFNPRQYGQPAISLDDSAAEGALAMQFGSNSLAPHGTLNPRQNGQPAMSLDESAAEGARAMQFGSNSLAPHSTFNPRQYGQPAMSLDDSAVEGALAMQFGSNSLAPHGTFNPRQYGQPAMSLDDSAAEGALTMQFGSNSLAPHDTFSPKHGQLVVSASGLGAQDAIGTQLYSSQMPHDALGVHDGQPMVSSNVPTEQGMYNVQNSVNVNFGLVEVQS